MSLNVMAGRSAFPSSPEVGNASRSSGATVGESAQSESMSHSAETPLPRASCRACISMPRNDEDTGSSRAYPSTYIGPQRFKERELSDAEKYHLDRAVNDRILHHLRISRLFDDPILRLGSWPTFFPDTEKSGEELRNGFATLWTTFILAESLLATIAMQPLISVLQTQSTITGWQFKVFGSLWMVALIGDYLSLSVTALFLGFLFANPPKVSYMFACNLGAWIGIPSVLVLAATFESLIAIGFSSWVIYGRTVGIFCAAVEVFAVAFAIYVANCVGKASAAVAALD